MTNHKKLFDALMAPFADDEIKILSVNDRDMPYVTARTVMNRLDDVLGPENWWDDYHASENSVLCSLSIRLPDKTVLTKQDAGGFPEMKSAEDSEKGGFSDAFKRAAVKFGIARYLYRDGVPRLVEASADRPVSRQPQEASRSAQETRNGRSGNPQASPKSAPSRSGAQSQGLEPSQDAATLVAVINEEVSKCNAAWLKKYPKSVPIAAKEAVILYLVNLTYERSMHPFDPETDPPDDPQAWDDAMGILYNTPKIKKWMDQHIIYFLHEQFRTAEASLST